MPDRRGPNNPTCSAEVELHSENNGNVRGVKLDNVIRVDHYFLGKMGAPEWGCTPGKGADTTKDYREHAQIRAVLEKINRTS